MDDHVELNIVKHWKSLKKKPKIIVFDLDYTLWPYYVDCHVSPPIKIEKNQVFDSEGFLMNGFKDVGKILKTLKEHCIKDSDEHHLAIASRSTTRDLAIETIEALGWREYFSSIQIYPTSKKIHMEAILKDVNLHNQHDEILFFDDESHNITTTRKLGVTAIEIDSNRGLDIQTFIEGLNLFESGTKSNKKYFI